MKRIILTIIIFFSITVNVLADTDFEVAKAELEELGIIENSDYNAESITRAEMIQIMYRMTNGAPIVHRSFLRTPSDKFEDMDEDYWAYEYIETFRYSMIIFGHGNGYFRPDDFITYAEMVTIIVRTLGWGIIEYGLEFPYRYLNIAQEWVRISIYVEDIHEKVSISSAVPIIYQALHASTLEYVPWRLGQATFERAPSFYERRNVE